MYRYSTENILSYPVTTGSKEDCIARIIQWVEDGAKGKYFVCANPHSLEMARKDIIFEDAIKKSDLTVPDGVGIVIASKILGGNINDRITGSDIFLEVSAVLNKKSNYTYFFLGSTEENLQKIKEKMKIDFPNILVAGAFSPPFKSEFNEDENNVMIDVINRAKPDVLWVGMTAPKQEKWIYQHKDQLEVKFIGAIGAVFDFYTGNVKW